MPREKECYRLVMERLEEAFPGKDMLTAPEVARFLGKDVRTVRKHYPIKKSIGISKAVLASALS